MTANPEVILRQHSRTPPAGLIGMQISSRELQLITCFRATFKTEKERLSTGCAATAAKRIRNSLFMRILNINFFVFNILLGFVRKMEGYG
jgi:hypothetical protein